MNDQRMNDQPMMAQEKDLANLLQQSLRPVNQELRRDLWPAMLRRLDENPREQPWVTALFSPGTLRAVPWFDWTMLAVLVAGVCLFPSSIPIWLYNF
jgi:hypothetical protein